MRIEAIKFSWEEELERTVVTSLVTSFGLDFLLFKDKDGGNVDTVHNARKGIFATEQGKQGYEQRGDYDSDAYHSHSDYKAAGGRDKVAQQNGTLGDGYRNRTMGAGEKRNLDHVISAKEIHDDAGRVLAGLNGTDLANQSSNLQSTSETINKSKKQSSIDEYLDKRPRLVAATEEKLVKQRKNLADMPRHTPEEQHKVRELESVIQKNEEKIKNLKSIDPDKMREIDKTARDNYNQQVDHKYYTSSKFLGNTAKEAGVAGLSMGMRQVTGLVMAEVWFELRKQLPLILEKMKQNFQFEVFIQDITKTLREIWRRVQTRFQDFLLAFKDGVFAGVLASATTTLFNILVTTEKTAIKIIREMWGQLVKAIKLLIFNPDKLSFVELCKAVFSILSVGVATVVGSMAYIQLQPLCSFPFGSELAAFVGALVTGVVTLGLNYFLIYSGVAQEMWAFIESIMPHADTVKRFQAINAELDRYLIGLARVEFNLDIDDLEDFSRNLKNINDEIQRSLLLKEEVAKRGIQLPYQIGDSASTQKWLASLVK